MPVKEITIASEDESGKCIFHIIFTPAGNIFRYMNMDPFGINIDERINLLCADVDRARLIYNSSIEILHRVIEVLERFFDREERELDLRSLEDSRSLLGLVHFNEGDSF